MTDDPRAQLIATVNKLRAAAVQDADVFSGGPIRALHMGRAAAFTEVLDLLAVVPPPPQEPADTYHGGAPMPQYAVLGCGPEAWADLMAAERYGIEHKLSKRAHVSLRWETMQTLLNVLRAVRLRVFQPPPQEPTKDKEDTRVDDGQPQACRPTGSTAASVDDVRPDCPDGQTVWFCCGYPTRCQRPSQEYQEVIGIPRP